jgi:hypothetical protein
VQDVSGNGLTLTASGGYAGLYNGNIPLVYLTAASSQRLYRSDEAALDIIGTEAYVASGWRGLTMGAWVHPVSSPTDMHVMGKWLVAGSQRSYNLRTNASAQPAVYISTDGSSSAIQAHTTALAADQWDFVCARFDPSTNVTIWLNDSKVENTTGIPATINNSTADFEIGSFNGGDGYFDGRISLAFLCAAAASDAAIRRLYYRTRPLFQNRSQW